MHRRVFHQSFVRIFGNRAAKLVIVIGKTCHFAILFPKWHFSHFHTTSRFSTGSVHMVSSLTSSKALTSLISLTSLFSRALLSTSTTKKDNFLIIHTFYIYSCVPPEFKNGVFVNNNPVFASNYLISHLSFDFPCSNVILGYCQPFGSYCMQ